MNVGALRTLVLDTNFSVHGVPIVVTTPGEEPIEAVGIWLAPVTEDVPVGSAWTRRTARRVLAIKRADVASVPIDTRITTVDRPGGTTKVWRVDGLEDAEADHHRVIVIEDEAGTKDLEAEA